MNGNKPIRILRSARKHGIPDVDIIHVLHHPSEIYLFDEALSNYLYIGYDTALRELEVITAEEFDDEIVVFHAMKITQNIQRWIDEQRRK